MVLMKFEDFAKIEDFIRKRVRCCACGQPLSKGYINCVALPKKASWKFPAWGNVISGVDHGALAIVCDRCIEEGRKPRYAVEFSEDGRVVYHDVVDLEDLEGG